jgi:7-cyano-7-deazaguanine synthase
MSSPRLPQRPAIILLSGGLDSGTALAIARHERFDCRAITFDYGQRHRVEIDAARAVAKSMSVVEHVVMKIDLRAFGGSALTDEHLAVPKDRDLSPSLEGGGQGVGESSGQHDSLRTQPRTTYSPAPSLAGRGNSDIPITYVPARNTIFLSFALAFAEVRGARDIFIGVNAVDYSGYPDCRPEFIRAFESMANLATRAGVEGQRITIHTPLIDLTKAQIIRRGIELGVDYGLTRSCYDPVPPHGHPCGHCDSCLLRAAGFREAGVRDPLMLGSDLHR